MTKKKSIKKTSKKLSKKYDPFKESLEKFENENDNLDQQQFEPGSYDYYQMKANHLIYDAWVAKNISEDKLDKIAILLKNNDPYVNQDGSLVLDGYMPQIKTTLDGYIPQIKTTTFTSTTFDDIVAFPKYPVSKPGFHVVGKTSDVDLNEQVIKTFEKDIGCEDDTKSFKYLMKVINEAPIKEAQDTLLYIENCNRFSANDKRLAKTMVNKRLEDKQENSEPIVDDSFNFDKALESMASRNEIKEKLKLLKEIHADQEIKFKKFQPLKPTIDSLKEIVDNDEIKKSQSEISQDKINDANKLFDKLADKAGQITKNYWKAKHKLVLINKFMEDFYAGKEFEFVKHNEKFSFEQDLQQAMDQIDGEDSEYKKSILKKVNPTKYK